MDNIQTKIFFLRQVLEQVQLQLYFDATKVLEVPGYDSIESDIKDLKSLIEALVNPSSL